MANLTIKELIDAMKSQSSGMNDQERKRNDEKVSNLESMLGEDTKKLDEIQKTNTQLKKTFGKEGDINKSLQEMIKFYKTSDKELKKHNKELLKKVDNLQKPQDRTKLGDIKYEKPITFKESMKEGVAGAKSLFSKVGGIGSGLLNTIKNPGQAINKVIGKAQDTFYTGFDNLKDIASTDKNYTAEAGRFGETYAKTDEGKKFGDKAQKMGEVGFNQLKAKEKEIADVESKIKEMKSQGFDPNKGDVEQLQSLKQQKSELDIRNPSKINAAISPAAKPEEKSQYAKVDSNQTPGFLKPLGNIGDKNEAGKNINAQDAAEAGAISKEESFLKQNPEGDNIQSANEKMADSLKELSLTSKDILIATRESVEILKSINKDLLGDNVQPLRTKEPGAGGGAPAEAAAAGSPSLFDTATDLASSAGDFVGKKRGKVASKIGKMGGKIMGGIKAAGPGLLKGGVTALGGMALGYGADKLKESGHEKLGGAADVGAEALSGAGMGAMIGSVIPGLGTAVGGAVGGVLGAGYGLYKNKDALFGGKDSSGGKTDTSDSKKIINRNRMSSSSGIPTINGFEHGYDLTGYAEDVRAAEIAWEQYSKNAISSTLGEKDEDKAERIKKMEEGAESFSKLAKKILSPEYQAEITKIQKSEAEPRAKGGPVKGGIENGADYLVGEEGPELFVPFKDGVVIPNDISQKLAPAAIKGGLKGLAEGGIVRNDDGSYNKGNRTYSPSISGFQRSVSNTGAETITGDLGPISITGEKDIYGNQRGTSFTAPLGLTEDDDLGDIKDLTLEAGKLQAGSTLQYAKATGRDKNNKEINIPTGDLLSKLAGSNESMRDEMSAKSGSSQPIIMNNSSSNATTKIMPMKADPRPSSRGSALERYEERTSVY